MYQICTMAYKMSNKKEKYLSSLEFNTKHEFEKSHCLPEPEGLFWNLVMPVNQGCLYSDDPYF